MDNVINEFVENAPIKGIKIKYGIYKNIDKNLSIATICDYASMAAETVMEDYNHDYAYYTDELAQKRLYNQMIENDFTDALKNKELVHDEKSNSNYLRYQQYCFLHVAEKKNCTRFLTCHSTRQIM